MVENQPRQDGRDDRSRRATTILIAGSNCIWLGLLLIGPFASWLPRSLAFYVGRGLVVLAVAIVLGNLFLICRRYLVPKSVSYYPLIAAIVATSGVALIEGAGILRWLQLLGGFAFLDLIVVPIVIGVPLCWIVGLFVEPEHDE